MEKLVKHYISGAEKAPWEQRDYCSTCRDGNLFEREYYLEGEYCNKVEERICGVCNTKYFFPRVKELKEIDLFILSEVNRIAEEVINSEANNMENIKELKEEYAQLGTCPKHIWNNPNPIITSEGKFQMECCLICHLGKVDYNGQKYEDNIMRIVTFIADQGMKFEKELNSKTKGIELL